MADLNFPPTKAGRAHNFNLNKMIKKYARSVFKYI